MAHNYRKSANDARERSNRARTSSNDHALDLSQMQKRAGQAADNVEKGVARQRKRQAAKKTPTR